MIRLIATDLDGTIVRHDGSVSARTLAALDAAADSRHPSRLRHRPPAAMDARVVADNRSSRRGDLRQRCLRLRHGGRLVVETFAMSVGERADGGEAGARGIAGRRVRSRDPRRLRPRTGIPAAVEPRTAARDRSDRPVPDAPVAKLLVRDDSLTGDVMLELARRVLDGSSRSRTRTPTIPCWS